MVQYFKLTSEDNQYVEFTFGLTSFRLDFIYNEVSNRYYINVYKNEKLVLSKFKIVWCAYNIFNSFKYKDIGELNIVSEEFEIINNRKEFSEITKDNITKFIFIWSYNE